MWVAIGLLALAGGLGWFFGHRRHRAVDPDDFDRDELERAEREVRDLDPSVSPDDADDQLPDWGPGAPRG